MKTTIFDLYPRFRAGLLYAAVTALILTHYQPARPRLPAGLVQGLWDGSNRGYQPLGAELAPVKELYARHKEIILITDHPFLKVQEETELQHAVQNLFAPVLVVTEPGPSAGFIYCSSDEIAGRRLQALGYDWVEKIAPGKGLVKKSS